MENEKHDIKEVDDSLKDNSINDSLEYEEIPVMMSLDRAIGNAVQKVRETNQLTGFVFNGKKITVAPGMEYDEIYDQFEPGHLEKVTIEKRKKFLNQFGITEEKLREVIKGISEGESKYSAQEILAASVESGIIDYYKACEILSMFDKDEEAAHDNVMSLLEQMQKK